jgi:hypothetical protein
MPSVIRCGRLTPHAQHTRRQDHPALLFEQRGPNYEVGHIAFVLDGGEHHALAAINATVRSARMSADAIDGLNTALTDGIFGYCDLALSKPLVLE